MIEKYLWTVGKYLAPKSRDEILKDIEINLYDYLEENYGKKDYTEIEVEKAIRAMGHPRKVAEAYMTEPRTLVGPAYIDTYWLVIKIALVSIIIGLTVAHLIDLQGATNAVKLFVGLAVDIFQACISAVGMITLIFAAVQFYNPVDLIEKDEEWSLNLLNQMVDPEQKIKLFDIIVETFVMALAFIALNQWLPYGYESGSLAVSTGKVVLIPYIMIIKLLLILGLLLNVYLMIKQRWQTVSRILSIVFDLTAVLLFTHLVLNPQLWRFLITLTSNGFNAEMLKTSIRLSVNIGLAAFVIVVGFNVYSHMKVLLMKQKKQTKE